MRRMLISLVLLAGCSAAGLPTAPDSAAACGTLGAPCCIPPGPPDDLAGAAYVYACGDGLWCEHNADGVTGTCRRSPVNSEGR